MGLRGRPKSSANTRREQLRLAKRAQRARQRQAKVVEVQVRLPEAVGAKLAAARRAAAFPEQLEAALDRLVVRPADYPELRDLVWNRVDEFIPARDAWQLYERNWRFIALPDLQEHERRLIERLKADYGNGEVNA